MGVGVAHVFDGKRMKGTGSFLYVRAGRKGWVGSVFSPLPPTGPPVNVAMAIEVASIDHISEANMVKYLFPVQPEPAALLLH